MTCLLSPWQLLSLSEGGRSLMNPAFPSSLADIGRYSAAAYPPSDAESQPGSATSGKKRASRAGTRSVSTLSAAQLDRKRANDREAQRAIRQRTKDHIESLEKTISELRLAQETAEKLLAASQQRSRDFEQENAFLRARLSEAGIVWAIEPQRQQNPSELTKNPARSTSPAATHASGPASVHSADTASHNGSALSLVTPRMAGAAHADFWQPQQPQMQVRSAPGSIHDPTSAPMAAHMPTWRSHDGGASHSMHTGNPMPDSPHEPAPPPPTHQPSPSPAMVDHYSPWAPAYHGHVLIPKRETTPHQEPQHFAPPAPTSSMYPPPQPNIPQQQQQQQQQQQPPAQQPTYQPTAMTSTPPPQASYQGVGVHVHVNSPVVYQVHQQPQHQQQQQQQQQPPSHQGQYQMASGHASPGMRGGTFPPPPMQADGQSAVAPTYDPAQQYGQPGPHPAQFADSMGPPHQTPHYQNG